MTKQPGIRDVKILLQARIRELVQILAPGGTFRHGMYLPLNPTRADKKPGSFVIWTEGTSPGAWKDYAADDKGDILDLIIYCKRLADRKQGYQWALDWLGIRKGFKQEVVAHARQAADSRNAKAKRREVDRLAADRRRAKAWWLNCQETILDTPAETYLETRGLKIRDMSRYPRALRYSRSLKHTATGSEWPGIVAAMTTAAGGLVAVHRTFIKPDGSGKAPVSPPRLIWPRGYAGGKIPLARGQSNLPEAHAIKRGIKDTLVLCEGVEDGLSIAMACPEYRIWAAGNLNNLGAIQVPACAEDVIIAADNDWTNRQAQKSLRKSIERLAAQGIPVRVARSPVGNDMNDLLTHEPA